MSDTGRRLSERERSVVRALSADPTPVAELAELTASSREALGGILDALEEDGLELRREAGTVAVVDAVGFTPATIEYGLEAPVAVEFHDRIESTNDRARKLAANGVRNVAVVAAEQPAGRGRRGREWAGPPGGVYASVVLDGPIEPTDAGLLTFAGAVATAEAIEGAGGDPAITWPNDVLLRDAPEAGETEPPSATKSATASGSEDAVARSSRGAPKVAGVLAESATSDGALEWAVVGVGANVDVPLTALPPGATSLAAAGVSLSRRAFLQSMVERLVEAPEDLARVRREWKRRSATLDRPVRVERAEDVLEGVAVDVTETGALMVDSGTDTVEITAGDVVHVRPQ